MTIPAPALHFDPRTHVYSVDGHRIPSVTEVLDSNGLYGWLDSAHPSRLERAKQRGTAVHRAIELYSKDRLDWSTVSPEIAGYLDGYVQWAAAAKWQAQADDVELRFWHQRYRYAGTIDQLGTLDGAPAALDVKSSMTFGPQACAAARLQLAAYCHHAEKPLLLKRVVLHLPGEGKYRERVFPSSTAARDFQMFLAALAIHNFKAQEGVAQ